MDNDKPKLPDAADIAEDISTVTELVNKYDAIRSILPGTLGSALGGLRTALRGLDAHAKTPTPADK